MPREFKLPDLGEGIHEAEVMAVHVAPGQTVKEGDTIFEVETDKAAVEIPSPYTGVVSEVLVGVGDLIKVGDVMLRFENGGDRPQPSATPSETALPAARRKPAPDRHRSPVPASPATRRLARELGIDLHTVTPTGPGGVVTADDVRAARQPDSQPGPVKTGEPTPDASPPPPGRPPAAALPDFSRWGPVERLPFRSIRRATANQMATAWSTIPHVSSQDAVDVTRLEVFRQKHKARIEAAGGRLTLTVFVLKALAAALKAYPQFNASLDSANQEIVHKQYYHIGVAVNTPDGLIVPVIRDVDRRSIKELAVALPACVKKTRERKIPRDDLQGGTFTITNAGAMGGGFFTPIINYPEVAILGMGQARLQPVVDADDNDRIVARLMMPVVLCFDHRIADGADAIGFLRLLMESLEDPDELLISVP